MNFAGLVHTIDIHGGVRRYFEIGNALVNQGHKYTLYRKVHYTKQPWINFKGNIDNLAAHVHAQGLDAVFTGAWECFDDIQQSKARVKVIMIVAKFYTQNLIKLWQKVGDSFLWIGVASEWNLGMECINGITIPGGINTDFFNPDHDKPESEKLRIGFYRRSGDVRGTDDVIALAKALKGQVEFIGYDAIDPGHHTLNFDHGCIELRAHKTQEDLRKTLQSLDIVVSAMKTAGWNNIVAEGMACGAVPICTPAGTRDFVDNGKTGYICEKENLIPDMIERIHYLNHNRRILKRLRAAAIEKIQDFSWDNFSKKLTGEVRKRI